MSIPAQPVATTVVFGEALVDDFTTEQVVGGAPFNVALIDCDEGFRLMSRVEDIAPDKVKIGQRVRFRVHKGGGEDDPYPVFVPAESV